jgi:bacillithiol biosynthesis deacetylase BshB1
MAMDFDIAGICAHPDDAELVMGGTLIRHARQGRRLALVDLTRGEMGSRGTPEIRAAEAAEAARILGVAHRETLGLPDARLTVGEREKDAVVGVLRRLRPRIVITQHWEQRHPDHTATSRIVTDACVLSGLRNYRPDLGTAYRPARILYATAMNEAIDITPSLVVDVTDAWDTKLQAVVAFASQFTPTPGEPIALPLDRFREAVDLSARRLGQKIGVTYGEGFVVKEPLRLDDLLSLGG